MTAPSPPAPEHFTSRLHSPAVSARVGLWLGVAFGLCFVTGLISHWAQEPQPRIGFPASPYWGYRLNQGLHVTSGFAAVPLLLVKLWSVYPLLFTRPPSPKPVGPVVREVLERLSIGVLVAAAIFQLATGIPNQAQWYTFPFPFRSVHYAVAWVAIGALVLHVAVKLPVIRQALGDDLDSTDQDRPEATREGALSRRGLLTVAAVAGTGAVLATAGGTVPWLRRVSVLAARSGEGPQGVPINISAAQAKVEQTARAADYTLTVVHGAAERTFTRADLLRMSQHTEDLPIACVEGWSATGRWTGPRMADVLTSVDAPTDADVSVVSLQERGAFAKSILPAQFVQDSRTLLALKLSGQDLTLDHGYPARVIAPNRPGVLQTKWVTRIEVLT